MKTGTYGLVRVKNHYHVIGERCWHKGRKKSPTKSVKKSRSVGIVLVSWALLAFLSLGITQVYALTSDEKWGNAQYVKEQEEIKKQAILEKFIGIEKKAIVSAYNSEIGQTDDSPFITANGKRVHDGIVANNCLPFGTKVVIHGRIYTVEDRMNKRYDCSHFDVWMVEKDDALSYGRKNTSVVILL